MCRARMRPVRRRVWFNVMDRGRDDVLWHLTGKMWGVGINLVCLDRFLLDITQILKEDICGVCDETGS